MKKRQGGYIQTYKCIKLTVVYAISLKISKNVLDMQQAQRHSKRHGCSQVLALHHSIKCGLTLTLHR